MPNDNDLPSISNYISNWLGFQLPAISLPQTVKNFDKAIGNILLAVGENMEARIKGNTAKAKAKGKIAVDGLYRTEEEKRKIENRAAAVQIAVDDLNSQQQFTDAQSEIDDDWLNLFARLAEDKSSEELQGLFGRILAGEIRKPGSFSLRTIQFLSTLSKEDAHAITNFLPYALMKRVVPLASGPSLEVRLLMEDLGLASTPNQIGGLTYNRDFSAKSSGLIAGTSFGIEIFNQSDHAIRLSVGGQILTKTAQELMSIADLAPTDVEFLKAVAHDLLQQIRGRHGDLLLNGTIKVFVVQMLSELDNAVQIQRIHEMAVQ
jgi:Protein of unknown function (DUF2806)